MIVRRTVFVTEQPGIVTRHVFSAGAHYDPANLSHGLVIGCDDHSVEPGAGFDRHAHRGVVIVSWVLSGTLRHEDAAGRSMLVEPGVLLVQSTGSGITHTETNASTSEPLRFVQTTLLVEAAPSVRLVAPPDVVAPGITFGVADAIHADADLVIEIGGVPDVLVMRFSSGLASEE